MSTKTTRSPARPISSRVGRPLGLGFLVKAKGKKLGAGVTISQDAVKAALDHKRFSGPKQNRAEVIAKRIVQAAKRIEDARISRVLKEFDRAASEERPLTPIQKRMQSGIE